MWNNVMAFDEKKMVIIKFNETPFNNDQCIDAPKGQDEKFYDLVEKIQTEVHDLDYTQTLHKIHLHKSCEQHGDKINKAIKNAFKTGSECLQKSENQKILQYYDQFVSQIKYGEKIKIRCAESKGNVDRDVKSSDIVLYNHDLSNDKVSFESIIFHHLLDHALKNVASVNSNAAFGCQAMCFFKEQDTFFTEKAGYDICIADNGKEADRDYIESLSKISTYINGNMALKHVIGLISENVNIDKRNEKYQLLNSLAPYPYVRELVASDFARMGKIKLHEKNLLKEILPRKECSPVYPLIANKDHKDLAELFLKYLRVLSEYDGLDYDLDDLTDDERAKYGKLYGKILSLLYEDEVALKLESMSDNPNLLPVTKSLMNEVLNIRKKLAQKVINFLDKQDSKAHGNLHALRKAKLYRTVGGIF